MQVIRFHGSGGMEQAPRWSPQGGHWASGDQVSAAELPSVFQQSQCAGKVIRYQQKTGFPQFDEVVKCIEQDARRAMVESAQGLKVKILYAGYDPNCSVGRGFPLPGSDLEHWMILLDSEDPAMASAFQKSVRHKVDLEIQGHANDASPSVVLKSQVKAYQAIAHGRRNPVIKDFRAWDSCAQLVEIVRDGKGLIPLEDPADETGFKERLLDSPLYKTAKELGFLKPYNHTFNKTGRPQNNYSFRRLLQKQFMVLSPQAQEVVIRVLQSQNLPTDKQTISLFLEPSNPDYPQLVSLIDQGVLEKIEEPTKVANKFQAKAFPLWFATDHPEKLEAAQKRSLASGLMTWDQLPIIS